MTKRCPRILATLTATAILAFPLLGNPPDSVHINQLERKVKSLTGSLSATSAKLDSMRRDVAIFSKSKSFLMIRFRLPCRWMVQWGWLAWWLMKKRSSPMMSTLKYHDLKNPKL